MVEFHGKQNAKKPGCVHATYLVSGTRREQPEAQPNGTHPQQDGEDTVMQSSPSLPSSSIPHPEESQEEPALVKTILLAREEHLEEAKATLEEITGIHIYSLEAKGLSDLQSLTECSRKIAADTASEDPLQAWKHYGTIRNPNVKRRTLGHKPPPPPAPAPAARPDTKAKHTQPASKPAQPTTKPALERHASKDSQDSKPASKPSSAKATPEPQKKPAAPKRQDSNIFKSFAKGRTKPKTEESQSSAEASKEDEAMNDFSDDDDADEGADEDVVEEVSTVPEGKSKKEREAELQAMMDQEDEVMEDAADDTPDNVAEEDERALDKAQEAKPEEPKETVTVENGRRRGRRRVMKKKTVKDEDGYLGKFIYSSNSKRASCRIDNGAVTKEEAAWESFSEDEPAPKKIKAQPAASTTSRPAAKKGGAKAGQGNIMSFFSKK
jgi:DNA polymerase delta subunit 3